MGTVRTAKKAAQRVPKMTDAHKEALANGRAAGRVVRRYLYAVVEAPTRTRTARRSAAAIEGRLAAVDEALATAAPLQRLHLLQERIDLEAELEAQGPGEDLGELEEAFVQVAATYSARKGIGYSAWRAIGVDPRRRRRTRHGRR